MNLLQNIKDLPPQKKRVLAMGGVAFVVLVFVSFLLSLSEDSTEPTKAPEQAPTAQATPTAPQTNQQRYDFEQGSAQSSAQQGALEDLLKSPAPQDPTTTDPFAGMAGTGTEPSSPEMTPEVAPGTAPIPEEQAPAPSSTILICDTFGDAASAESKKAILAFQGMGSTVVKNADGTFSLKLGPYGTPEQARTIFGDLSDKGLLERCALITK